MEFEWDEEKSDACYVGRGFDFAYIVAAFFDNNRLIRHDKRSDYGEERYQLLGKIDGRLFFVAYTHRKHAIRIISARKANSREIRDYENENNSSEY
jgi:uncharacterized protein